MNKFGANTVTLSMDEELFAPTTVLWAGTLDVTNTLAGDTLYSVSGTLMAGQF